jgi:hypothetical protein
VLSYLKVLGDRGQRQHTGYWVLGTGYWVLGTGYWVLGTGYWVLGTGYWVLGTGYWVLGTGYWVLAVGKRLGWHDGESNSEKVTGFFSAVLRNPWAIQGSAAVLE